MFNLLIASILIVCCNAGDVYGTSRGEGGYSGGVYEGRSNHGRGAGGRIIPAAVITRHSTEYRDVPSSGSIAPIAIEVGSNFKPLTIGFKSSSSHINVQQKHEGGGGYTQFTRSEDRPHTLTHVVHKPVTQELHEVITPRRKIIQEIRPVQEEIRTIVATGERRYNKSSDGGGSEGFTGRSGGESEGCGGSSGRFSRLA